MRRSQRTSAIKAQQLFQQLDLDDNEVITGAVVKEEPTESPPRIGVEKRQILKEAAKTKKTTSKKPQSKAKTTSKRKTKTEDDEDFVPEEQSEEEEVDPSTEVVTATPIFEKDNLIDAAVLNGADAVALFPNLREYSNWQQRKKRDLIEEWKDFFIKPTVSLREFPKGITSSWKKTVAKNGKVSCDLCDKSFTTYAGMSYHYRRCGIDVNIGGVCCKLCGFRDKSDKKLLPHMASHLDELPPVSDQLKLGLKYERVVTQVFEDETEGSQTPTKKKKDKPSKPEKDRRPKKITVCVQSKLNERFEETALAYRRKMERLDLFQEDIFMPKVRDWIRIKDHKHNECLPQNKTSCKFKFGEEDSWKTLDLFKSASSTHSPTFFVGGTVWSCSWAPFPSTVDSCQEDSILALGVTLSVDDTHNFEAEGEQGLIQFWNFSNLSLNDTSVDPKVSFAISHDYGVIWGMEWTPFGNSWRNNSGQVNSGIYDRLGLLALACGDSHVRILSIPHPKTLLSTIKSTKVPIFTVTPVITFSPSENEMDSICRCISWSKWHSNSLIAGGYSNGTIVVWDLISKEKQVIHAHASAVTCLSFCPRETSSVVLASGGHLDKNVFIWDLDKLPFPYQLFNKSIVRDIEWIWRHEGVIINIEDCFLNTVSTNHFVPINPDFTPKAIEAKSSTTLNAHKATAWSCSYNDWTHSAATVDAAGEAVIFKDVNLAGRRARASKKTVLVRFPIFSSNLDVFERQEKENEDRDKKISVHRAYRSITAKYGIVFKDYDVSSLCSFKNEDLVRVHNSSRMSQCHPSNYPLTALTQVKFNPNKDSYTWMVTTGQNGLCRLICCPFLRSEGSNVRIPYNKDLEMKQNEELAVEVHEPESDEDTQDISSDFYTLPHQGIEVSFVPDFDKP